MIQPSKRALAAVSETEPQVALILDANYVAAIVKLRNYDNTYLHVARPLDPRIVAQLSATRESVSEYAALQARRLGVQIAFALMYTVIALSVLLSAVWIALNFANLLVAPIRRLIGAANLVSTGNLYVQVPIRRSEGDLAHLGETFNKMTQELRTTARRSGPCPRRHRQPPRVHRGGAGGRQRRRHRRRRRGAHQHPEPFGRAADRQHRGGNPWAPPGRSGARACRHAVGRAARRAADARTGHHQPRGTRTQSVGARDQRAGRATSSHGYVITLDDITELVTAQRTSAWADIARRIAHEIKNPLTPIQLSAERLRRKYGKVIVDEPAVFQQCTDTIVRQVDDIKRMVDEFSRFARMPKPVMVAEDVAETVRQAVFLMRVGHSDVDIDVEIAEDPMPARFDRRLISQALTNIIKNATEAIAAVPPEELGRGRYSCRSIPRR